MSSKSSTRSAILYKQHRAVQAKSASLPDDVCRFTVTTDAIDRDGDVVVPKGLQLDDYLSNPVFLWSHQFGIPAIGKCINIALSPDGREVWADIQFAVKENEFAAQVCRLYKGGYLNAVSIGFKIVEAGPPDRYIPSRPDLGMQCKRVIRRAVLLEISAVNIPSNPEALAKALASGRIVISKALRDQIMHDNPLHAALGWLKKTIGFSDATLAKLTLDDVKGLANVVVKAEPTETAEGQEVACEKCGKKGAECKCPKDADKATEISLPGQAAQAPNGGTCPKCGKAMRDCECGGAHGKGAVEIEIKSIAVVSVDEIVNRVVAQVTAQLPEIAKSAARPLREQIAANIARLRGTV